MPYHGVRGDFLLGLVAEGKDYSLEEQTLGGCRFCVLTLPEGKLRRQMALRRGARELQRRRVRRCVFPEGFTLPICFSQRGIAAVDVQPLLRKKAGQWVFTERQARGLGGNVAVNCERLTEDVEHAVRLLLDQLGSVSLPPVRGAEELQKELRWDSGAVLRLLPKPKLFEAETLLDFSDSPAEGQALTLRLGESRLPCFSLPKDLTEEFPPLVDHAQLAAALWEMGKLPTDRIGLKSRM